MIKPDDVVITVRRGIYSVERVITGEHINNTADKITLYGNVLNKAVRELNTMEQDDAKARETRDLAKELYADWIEAISGVPLPWDSMHTNARRFWLDVAKRVAP